MLNFHTTWYLGAFGIADCESVFRFQKFKVADPIWRTALFEINRIRFKLLTRRFSGSLKQMTPYFIHLCAGNSCHLTTQFD